MRIDRRTLLKGLGAAAVAPALTRCAPGETPVNVTPALLRERIKTVVVLMMENRSFDHVFGSYSLLEGRTDIDGLQPGMKNNLTNGTPIEIHLADKQCIEDPGHGWNASHKQWNEGANDGFVRNHEERYGVELAHRPMGYLDRAMAPAMYALADRYALCQRWFCSVLGPTWPNRYYSLLATSNGNQSNDPIPDVLPSTFSRLDDAFIKWKNYYGNLPFSFLLPTHSLEQAEYQRLDTFFDDAAAGTLPAYVHLDPIYGRNDDHPPAHPLAGNILIASIYAALAQSPQWNECLFVITYDEHGGFYDHVAPPEVQDDFTPAGFTTAGFRVPAIVAGPYVQPQVSSTVFDHASIPASVLRLHELPSINVREQSSSDWWHLLDPQLLADGDPQPPIAMPVIDAREEVIHAEECNGLAIDFLHAPATATSPTGQPELEQYADAHPSAKDGRRDQELTWLRILDHARRLGVIS